MDKQDLENLITDQCLAELAKMRPEMKLLNQIDDIERFIDSNFTKAQLSEIYQKVSVKTIGDFVDLAEESEDASLPRRQKSQGIC